MVTVRPVAIVSINSQISPAANQLALIANVEIRCFRRPWSLRERASRAGRPLGPVGRRSARHVARARLQSACRNSPRDGRALGSRSPRSESRASPLQAAEDQATALAARASSAASPTRTGFCASPQLRAVSDVLALGVDSERRGCPHTRYLVRRICRVRKSWQWVADAARRAINPAAVTLGVFRQGGVLQMPVPVGRRVAGFSRSPRGGRPTGESRRGISMCPPRASTAYCSARGTAMRDAARYSSGRYVSSRAIRVGRSDHRRTLICDPSSVGFVIAKDS